MLCRLTSLLLTVAAYASVCSAESIRPPDAQTGTNIPIDGGWTAA